MVRQNSGFGANTAALSLVLARILGSKGPCKDQLAPGKCVQALPKLYGAFKLTSAIVELL